MTIFARLFKREPAQEVIEAPTLSPDEIPNPETLADFLRRAWAYRARGQEDLAEDDFRQALTLNPRSIDAAYGLGMALKGQGKVERAIEAFQKAVALLDEGVEEDHDRKEMLHRLALGHVNFLTKGDWSLEKEIWRREK